MILQRSLISLSLGCLLIVSLPSHLSCNETSVSKYEEEAVGGKTVTTPSEDDTRIFPFNMMTQEEADQTGINKLSLEEQSSLLTWVKTRNIHLKVPIDTTLKSVAEGGKVVEMTSGQSFSINSSGKRKVSQWVAGDGIQVFETGKPDSYLLKNVRSQDTVKAKSRPNTKKK